MDTLLVAPCSEFEELLSECLEASDQLESQEKSPDLRHSIMACMHYYYASVPLVASTDSHAQNGSCIFGSRMCVIFPMKTLSKIFLKITTLMYITVATRRGKKIIYDGDHDSFPLNYLGDIMVLEGM